MRHGSFSTSEVPPFSDVQKNIETDSEIEIQEGKGGKEEVGRKRREENGRALSTD